MRLRWGFVGVSQEPWFTLNDENGGSFLYAPPAVGPLFGAIWMCLRCRFVVSSLLLRGAQSTLAGRADRAWLHVRGELGASRRSKAHRAAHQPPMHIKTRQQSKARSFTDPLRYGRFL